MQTRWWHYVLINRMGARPSFIIESMSGRNHRAYSLTLHNQSQISLHDELKVSANEENAIKFLVALSKLSAPYTSDAHPGLAELAASDPVLSTRLQRTETQFAFHRTYTPEERGARLSDSELSRYFSAGSYKMTHKKTAGTVKFGKIKRGELTCFAIVTQRESHRYCYETYFTERESALYDETMSGTETPYNKLVQLFKTLDLHYHPELTELSKNDRVLSKALQAEGVKTCKILSPQEIAKELQLSRSIDKGTEIKLPKLTPEQQMQRETAKSFQLAEGAIQKFDTYRRTVSSDTLKATEMQMLNELRVKLIAEGAEKANELIDNLRFYDENADYQRASAAVRQAKNDMSLLGPHGIYADRSTESLYNGDELTQSQDRDRDMDMDIDIDKDDKTTTVAPKKSSDKDGLGSRMPDILLDDLPPFKLEDIPITPASLTEEEIDAMIHRRPASTTLAAAATKSGKDPKEEKSESKSKQQTQTTRQIQASLTQAVKSNGLTDDETVAFQPLKRGLGCGDITQLTTWKNLAASGLLSQPQKSSTIATPAFHSDSSKRPVIKQRSR